jgi:hypothetical protein
MEDLKLEASPREPLLLEGYGLQDLDGRLALCIAHRSMMKYDSSQHHSHDQQAHAHAYVRHEYDMFDEGDMWTMSDSEVKDALRNGSRVVIVEI